MSWDTYLAIDTGGDEPAIVVDVGNYTYNVSPMYRKALKEVEGGFSGLNGFSAEKAAPLIELAISRMIVSPETYREMEPDNKWGNYEGAIRYLRDLLDACKKHPKAFIEIT